MCTLSRSMQALPAHQKSPLELRKLHRVGGLVCACLHRPEHIGDSESVRNRMRFSCQPNGAHYGCMLRVDGPSLAHFTLIYLAILVHTVISMCIQSAHTHLGRHPFTTFTWPCICSHFRRRAWPAVQIDFMLGKYLLGTFENRIRLPHLFIRTQPAQRGKQ